MAAGEILSMNRPVFPREIEYCGNLKHVSGDTLAQFSMRILPRLRE